MNIREAVQIRVTKEDFRKVLISNDYGNNYWSTTSILQKGM